MKIVKCMLDDVNNVSEEARKELLERSGLEVTHLRGGQIRILGWLRDQGINKRKEPLKLKARFSCSHGLRALVDATDGLGGVVELRRDEVVLSPRLTDTEQAELLALVVEEYAPRVRYALHGDWGSLRLAFAAAAKSILRSFLPRTLLSKLHWARWAWRQRGGRIIGFSPRNAKAIDDLVARRRTHVKGGNVDPLCAPAPQVWPTLDISIVTFNNARWLERFFASLVAQDYPLSAIRIAAVDNGSGDETVTALREFKTRLESSLRGFEIYERPNRGFGAGHNVGIGSGSAEFCLVTNVDLEFTSDTLTGLVRTALTDPVAACWEARQKPYEHPKLYDPVTGETNWCSHACVLLRRAVFVAVGGYDERIFMYGEDVELSYRLRSFGYRLRYCPHASVWHYSYEAAGEVKPLQYSGGIFANLYIRAKFGLVRDFLEGVALGLRQRFAPEPYAGARRDVARAVNKAVRLGLTARLSKARSNAAFAFHVWDFELTREGAFVESVATPSADSAPLVSVVTRTVAGRAGILAQAMFSVAHQTYPNIEMIIVEDGGESQRTIVDDIVQRTGLSARYVPMAKAGRAIAGNTGLENAQGSFIVFLDDDDLLFADHVETLMGALERDPDAVAAYALAWETPTEMQDIADGEYREVSHIVHELHRQVFDYAVLRRWNYMPIQAVLFRKRLFDQRGGFHSDLEYLEDWNLWQRYGFGHHFAYVPKVTSLYRTPANEADRQSRSVAFDQAYAAVRARTAKDIRALSCAPGI